jgi:hypothetical protein
VTVRTDDEHAFLAAQIMDRNRAVDLAARRADYVSSGWTAFDEGAESDSQSRESGEPAISRHAAE